MKACRTIASLLTVLPLVLVGCTEDTSDDIDVAADEAALADPSSSDGEMTLATAAMGKPLLEREEVKLIDALQVHRAALRLPQLKVSIGLTRAAKAHAADMATRDFLGHESSDGTPVMRRIATHEPAIVTDAAPGPEWGEDVARSSTIEKGVDAFRFMDAGLADQRPFGSGSRHPGSNRETPNADFTFTHVGVGAAFSPGTGKHNWTVDYASWLNPSAILSTGIESIGFNGSFEKDDFGPARPWNKVTETNRWSLSAGANGFALAERQLPHLPAQRKSGRAVLWLGGDSDAVGSATQIVDAAEGVNYGLELFSTITDPPFAGPGSPVATTCTVNHVVYFEFLDATKRRIGHIALPNETLSCTPGDWKKLAVDTTSPPSTRFVRVVILAPRRSNTAAYDDVRITAW